jgi:hypothetical protein
MFRTLSLRFEWRSMGISAYLPFLVAALLVFIVYLNEDELPYFLPALEMLFPLFGCWWSVFVLHDLLAEEGGEVLFTYPRRRWHLGILRVFLFYLLYLLLMFVMLLGVGSVIGINQIPPLAWQYGVQSFFYSGLGFLAMVLTRSTGWSLILVTSYLSLMILTRGQSLQFLDIYLHNTSIMSIESMIPFLRKVGLYGLILYANAQYFLSTSNRFKQ